MKYKRFEDLPVWNAAIDLAVAIHALSSKSEFLAELAVFRNKSEVSNN